MTQQTQTKQLPKGWTEKKVEDFAEVITGGTPSTGIKEYWEGGNIPWLRSGELKDNILVSSRDYITELGLKKSAARIMPKGSVLIALTGATTGKVALLTFEASANQSVTGILPSEEHIPKFLFYYLQLIRNEIIHKSYGEAQNHISQGFVKKLKIPLPPIQTQRLIVSAIETHFSRLDNAIKNLKSVKEKIQLYRKAVLKKAFENGEKVELGKNFEVIMGQSPPSKFYNQEGKGLPFFQGKKEFNYKYPDIKIWTEKYNKMADKGDLLVSVRAPIGPCNIAPEKCAIGRGIAAIKANNETESLLLYYLIKFNEQKLDSKGTGTTFKAISKNSLNSFVVNLPKKENWEKVVSFIESKFSVIDKVEEAVDNSLKKAEMLKKAILKVAFEGRLVKEEGENE